MEFGVVLGVIAALLVGYFLVGIGAKFLWGWFPAIIGIPISIWIAIQGGYGLATLGVFLLIASVMYCDTWQDTRLHSSVEKKLDNLFYFKD